MKLGVKKLSSAVRLGLSLGAVIAVGVSTTAFAQDTGTQDTANQPSQKKAQTLQTVVVTGSNIRRVDLETSNPVVTIDAAAIKATGKLTLGDIVQQLPAVTGGNINPQVNNSGGTGGSSIGLRGLGSQRTLILIDGKRIINGDPNSIPADMIERIEVLTDGASSVYGSDAIGGVVNFILKKDYQGAQFSATYGESDHNDGASTGYTFTFGQTSDKGSIMGGVDYNKTESVLAKNRKFSQNAVSITGSASTPIYSYIGGSSFPAHDRIQLPPTLRATYGCKNVAINPGASGQNTATDYHCFTNSDKYNYAAVNLIQTPQERTSAWLKGSYNLGDHVQVYLTGYHNKTASAFQLAPALLGSIYGAVISKDAYYNPFGVEFSSAGNDYRARLVSAGNRSANSGITTDQIQTGFKGDFTVFGQAWNWDAGLDYGHFSQNLITRGLPNQNVINADLGPSHLDPASGQVVCNTPSSGCTPFNPFNLFDPNSIKALQAAAVPAISNNYSIEKTYSVDLNGGLFELPAGTVQLAGGASYRKEYTNSTIDPLLLIDPATGNCTLGSQCSSPLRGGYNVKEGYAELFVPILKDIPGITALNVDIGDRYSKYSTFGTTNNKKFAIEYRPIADLLLRGTMSDVFRAPTVGNVYGAPISDAPKLSSDPCDHTTTAGNPACVGVPTDGSFVNQDVALGQQIKAVSSGSKYAGFPLGPEKGKSFDFGAVYSPSWAPGLSASVDVWRLYLKNTITAIGAQTVLNLCYNGVTTYCPLVTRSGAGSTNPGQIAQIIEPTGNLGRTDASGVDLSLRYKVPQFGFGNFMVGVDGTYMKRYDQETSPGLPGNTVYHEAGHFEFFGSPESGACPTGGGVCLFPRWRGQGFVNWNLAGWNASWRMRYIGRYELGSPVPGYTASPIPGIPNYVMKKGATVYNDVSIGYNIEQFNTRVDFGVNNLFDKQPPMLYANNTLNANTDPSDFDLQGRYFWGRVTVSF
ncbi:TonB-dependent receptor [Rhodanobacter denitrificans]|uniref:TonB-dependent receptor n=1 Tax=Rhodanobacter denitrificans TaxID=666685 RepID=A0A368KEU9_9GAMM|nr:TonB-dependent receptor plug domain-containing protein [Rhodanobacter denitrificans]RCS29626.1 TonB-dependent receptor [Rhodanobacter denitrificans]